MRILLCAILLFSCTSIDRAQNPKKEACLQSAKAKIIDSYFLTNPESKVKDLHGTRPGAEYLNFLSNVKCDFYFYSLQPEKVCRSWMEGNKLDCMESYWRKSVSNRAAPKELLFDMLDFFLSEITMEDEAAEKSKVEKELMVSDSLDASLLALELISYRTRPVDILSFTDKKEEWAVYRIQQWENQSSLEKIRELYKRIQGLIEEHGEMSKSEAARKRRFERQMKRFESLKALSF